MRARNAESANHSASVRKDNVLRRDLAHRLIETVERTVALRFRRPDIVTAKLLSERLLMVDPPVTHGLRIATGSRYAARFEVRDAYNHIAWSR